jgi:hypothetical protein
MIWYLKHYFSPREVDDRAFSLAISVGSGGARLSHPHERQYAYVLQSLTLWREVTHDMFRLWYLAEEDLLREGNWYRLADTGQGLNRVQQAPAVLRAIHALLRRCQERLGSWVGSSVVHLGDHNVPNARASCACPALCAHRACRPDNAPALAAALPLASHVHRQVHAGAAHPGARCAGGGADRQAGARPGPRRLHQQLIRRHGAVRAARRLAMRELRWR